MKKINWLLLIAAMLNVACDFKLPRSGKDDACTQIEVQRYDRAESRYLMTGDFSALQQMNTGYPMETRALIEDLLKIGEVNDPQINTKLLKFYQDSALQTLISDAEAQYANMDDINKDLTEAFGKLKQWLPDLPLPTVYAQITALDQSIVIGNQSIGISLDKYLGADYPLYLKYYSREQRRLMTRRYIVPDCVSFYLMSVYPLSRYDIRSQQERDLHMGKIMWIVNRALGQNIMKSRFVDCIDRYMKHHTSVSIAELLRSDDYSAFID